VFPALISKFIMILADARLRNLLRSTQPTPVSGQTRSN
jgi:hypothetical protein